MDKISNFDNKKIIIACHFVRLWRVKSVWKNWDWKYRSFLWTKEKQCTAVSTRNVSRSDRLVRLAAGYTWNRRASTFPRRVALWNPIVRRMDAGLLGRKAASKRSSRSWHSRASDPPPRNSNILHKKNRYVFEKVFNVFLNVLLAR